MEVEHDNENNDKAICFQKEGYKVLRKGKAGSQEQQSQEKEQ